MCIPPSASAVHSNLSFFIISIIFGISKEFSKDLKVSNSKPLKFNSLKGKVFLSISSQGDNSLIRAI